MSIEAKLTRRSVLGGMAGASAAALALGMPKAAFAQTGEVTLFTWETYHEDPWIAEYEAATGVKINVIRTGSVDEMYAQTRSGAVEADILYFDTGSIPRYKDAGLIEVFDASQVPNSAMVSPSMDWENKSTVDGQLWGGIPYNWGTQPLMYNRDMVDEEPTSWAALWDPRYKGKVSMFDDAYITFPMIALYVGAADPFNLTEEEFGKCAEALRRLRPQVGTIARGFDDATTLYASGDAVIGYCQNIAIVNDLNALGNNFAYSLPVEGTPTWIDNAVITKRGNRKEVYDFINANLTKEWQSRFIADSANNGILTAEVAQEAGIPEDVLKKTNILDQASDGFWDKMVVFQPPEDIDRRLGMWNDFKAGTL
jgi:spermidine/putrescine transport system substrate-binding protein